ncbi:MAG: T9SS type A sorting domain-containing protein [Bacteroidota bacterium]|nr:T9SS type A sorting domain-containing protein [Bacteroidota bacterium]
MKTFLLFLSLLTVSIAHAQVIPGDTPGDGGWLLVDGDTLNLVRADDGHAWLQQNLGSSTVASAANEVDAFGALYQWGRWTDGHQIRNSSLMQASSLVNNDPSGLGAGSTFFYIGTNPADWWSAGQSSDSWIGTTATATNGIDPCSMLGENWHIPSQADWMNLIALEGITDVASAFGSNLKLSAAGSRDGQTGTIINAGLYGNYWSSTANGLYAKDLTIGDTFVNADDDAYRSYGMSVRCINRNLHTGITAPARTVDLNIFPNPSRGNITIGGDIDPISVEVCDLLSRSLAVFPMNNGNSTIDLDHLPEGSYWIKVITSDGAFQKLVIIER